MTLNADNVRVAVTGALSLGSTSAVAPVDVDTALGTGWVDLGYISEDGVVEGRDRNLEPLRAWQNADLLREEVTEASMTFQCTLVETKAEVVSLFYGATVDPLDGSVTVNPSAPATRQKFVLDVVDGTELIRVYIPSGAVTEVGEQTYASGTAVGYNVTITAYATDALLNAAGKPSAVKKFYSSLVA